jgi:hypothetical protein
MVKKQKGERDVQHGDFRNPTPPIFDVTKVHEK